MPVSTDLGICPVTAKVEQVVQRDCNLGHSFLLISNLPGMLSGPGTLAGLMLFKTFATSDDDKISSLRWSVSIAVVTWGHSIVPLFAVKTD